MLYKSFRANFKNEHVTKKEEIRKAINLAHKKGGYDFYWKKNDAPFYKNENGEGANMLVEDILLELKFWQALGKALGWPMNFDGMYWKKQAHRWLDAHFQGEEDEKAFWKSLLTNK